jgi:hypothetical protein
MRAAIVGLVGSGSAGSKAAPDGVRLQAVRFSEQAVLLYTATAKPPPPPGAASLAGVQTSTSSQNQLCLPPAARACRCSAANVQCWCTHIIFASVQMALE